LTSHKPLFTCNYKARHALAFFVFVSVLTGCFDSDPLLNVSTKTESVYVVKVKDGDSLILRGKGSKEFEARLFGIDAPELNQPHGKEAMRALSKLAFKQRFVMDLKDTDKYQRAIVILEKTNLNINKEMVVSGNAWVYRKYNPDPNYIKLEQAAKKSKKGLWRLPKPIAPWDWRKQKR